jgi:hypothetical protein
MKRLNFYAGLLALLAMICGPATAFAQSVLTPPIFAWGIQGNTNPGPVVQIGFDTITGLPCIAGSTVTCATDRVAFVSDYEVSAANTAQTFTYKLRNAGSSLSISAACSAGTATVTVAASPDNSHFVTIDSIAAAASIAKFYSNTTVGATTALSPISFPYVQVTVGPCGASNTSTLIVGAK